MPELPSGTVTFLFTDIEGSTRLLKQLRDRYAELLGAHQRLLRDAFERAGGQEIDTQGDSFFVAFRRARDAVTAAVDAQRALAAHSWPEGAELRVRMGIHTGEPAVGEERYVGLGVHRAARICAAGHGGQILLSNATRELIDDELPEDVTLRDLGEARLKDIDRPERIFQLVVDGLSDQFPPLKTVERQPEHATEFAGREGELAEAAETALASRRFRSRGSAFVAAASVAAAGVGVAAFLLVGRSGTAQALSAVDANAVGVVAAGSNRITEQVPVGATPTGVAVGEGAVWVTNADDHTVSRIDPDAAAVRQTIAVGSGPRGVAVGGGAVWVANALDGTVSRIDPGTNQVVQTIAVGNGPTDVAFGDGFVWVVNAGDDSVSRIAPETGKVLDSFAAGVGAGAIAVTPDAVWVASDSAGHVARIDPRTRSIVQTINVGNGGRAIAAGGGAVWVANSLDGTVSKIDPQTNTVAATIAVGDGASGVAVSKDAVWVSNEFGGALSRIDPRSEAVVTTIRLQNRPEGVALSGDRVFVAVRASGRAHRGGTLKIAAGEIDSLDPARGFSIAAYASLIISHDGLTTFKRVGGSEGAQLVPDLATSLPTPADGGKTYSFQLRPGIRYSNGTLVKPEDFRYGIERAFEIGERTSPVALFLSGIVGAGACAKHAGGHCDLSKGIVTNDAERTVTFHLVGADPELLYKLALPVASPVPVGTSTKDAPTPGTGPYKVATYLPKRRLRLVRNPLFREWSKAAQPDGYPDEIDWTLGRSPEMQVKDVERGRADWAADGVPAAAFEETRTQYASQEHVNPQLDTFYVALNTRVPPFDRESVRKALNYAVDRMKLEGPRGYGSARMTCQVLPPNMPGYRPYCPYTLNPSPSGLWTAPDHARAQRLVDHSGTKGMRVTVWGPGPFKASGSYLVGLLSSLGYRAQLKIVEDFGAYFSAVSDSRRRIQAASYGYLADYPAPSNFIGVQFTCGSFHPGTPANTNVAEFCDPKIDAEVKRALALQLTDPFAANAAWSRIDRRIVDSAPLLPTINKSTVDLVSKRVGNYEYNPEWGMMVDQAWVR